MVRAIDNFEKYKNTYSGKKLLEAHALAEVGVWEVRGEDPNCDFGGAHHQPLLGYFEGKLEDVVRYAVELPNFWEWGSGGSIRLHKQPLITKIDANSAKKRTELKKRKEQLEQELAEIKTALGD